MRRKNSLTLILVFVAVLAIGLYVLYVRSPAKKIEHASHQPQVADHKDIELIATDVGPAVAASDVELIDPDGNVSGAPPGSFDVGFGSGPGLYGRLRIDPNGRKRGFFRPVQRKIRTDIFYPDAH